MPRPRAFDDAHALDAAVACFWRHGLEGASVRDLGAAMGIAGASLYNAFGDKRSLFLMALERYAETNLRPRIARLEADTSPRAAIAAFVDELISRSLDDPERRGCLLINTALEAAASDPEIRDTVARYFQDIEAFFAGRLSAARALGEIPATLASNDMAGLLLGLVIAVRVRVRAGAGRAELEGMVRPALAMLGVAPKRRRGAVRRSRPFQHREK